MSEVTKEEDLNNTFPSVPSLSLEDKKSIEDNGISIIYNLYI
jgi:hypothetical protein